MVSHPSPPFVAESSLYLQGLALPPFGVVVREARDMTEREKCQHHRVDNETWECVECGTRMTVRTEEPEMVLDAPNAAACNNRACQTALDEGTYDGENPPAGCTNPSGVYIPDRGRERRVIIGMKYTYECDRCYTDGQTLYTRHETVWGCGKVHRGDYLPVQDSVRG